jgi:hypothetical protein
MMLSASLAIVTKECGWVMTLLKIKQMTVKLEVDQSWPRGVRGVSDHPGLSIKILHRMISQKCVYVGELGLEVAA